MNLLDLPAFDLAALETLLGRDLAALDMHAAKLVQDHLAGIGQGGEEWIANGMQRVQASGSGACPFCAQDLRGSSLIDHYRSYFSASYDDLKRAISKALVDINMSHGASVATAFERGIRVWGERRQFWSKFCDLPDVGLDTAAVARAWDAARTAVQRTTYCQAGRATGTYDARCRNARSGDGIRRMADAGGDPEPEFAKG